MTQFRSNAGFRDDIGIYVRSSWESNYARILNLWQRMKIVERWDYEPETFWFDGIRRGTVSYKPDFRVVYRGDPRLEYVEIKGRVMAIDHTKWKRMAKYHPNVKLVIIGAKEYRELASKWASAIPNWERAK